MPWPSVSRALAGAAIPPAHPKTKVVGKVTRSSLAMSWDWLPRGDRATRGRAADRRGRGVAGPGGLAEHADALPRGRTPLQAAKAGDAAVPLRAAVFQLEQTREAWREVIDFDALRATPETRRPSPTIDPETVDVETPPPRAG